MFYSAQMYNHLEFGIDFLWIFQALEDHGQQTAPKICSGPFGFFEDLRQLPFRGQTALQVTWGGSSPRAAQNHPIGAIGGIMIYTLWWTNILPWKITIFNGKIHYFDGHFP